ncbi:MAG: glutamate---cysteine ligase / carboxylate-amine ligase [Solirubrobacterales bacterium]|nr:glutamate---cysteine ligase / carboxylate-amine ligase [Solirubrobacterales bacterium]
MLEHEFTGPEFTVGIEEELMILDPDGWGLAQRIEDLLAACPPEIEGQVKPELFKAVLEIATKPHDDVAAAGRELVALREAVIEITESAGMAIAAAATHPFARPADQEIVDRPRYHELVDELGIIALNELIFGTHVHVGIEGADRAIYVADGIRRYLPLFLALSANSPFWEGERTGLMSSRVPVFRSFPREGIPPHYGTWEIFSHRVEMMMRAGAIEDYTFLWWDVRPHPNLGTVETRIFDQQTRVEHTVSLAALVVSLAHRMCGLYDDDEPLVEYPTELIDDNKIRAARHGTDGKLIDFRAGRQVPAPEMARTLVARLAPNADELGCRAELDGIEDLLVNGTGAHRQIEIADRNGQDLAALTEEIARTTKP